MSDTDVDIAVRWNEGGADVPARTEAGLNRMRHAAEGAAPAIGDRLTQAFARVEAREPTLMMRRARLAMDELTASAIGGSGPLARLGMSVAALGGGPATVAIAGFAGIIIEVKDLLEFSGKLEKQLESLTAKYATLGGAAAVGLAQATEIRAQEPEQPGWAIRLFARLGTLGSSSLKPLTSLRPEESGEGDLNQAIQTGFASQEATFETMANIADQRARQTRRREHLRAAGEMLKEIGSEDPTRQVPDLVGRKDQFTALGTEGGEAWGKALLAAIQREVPAKAVPELVARRADFQKLGGDAGIDWAKALLAEIGRLDSDQAVGNLLAHGDELRTAGADGGQMWGKSLLAAIQRELPDQAYHDLLALHGTFDRLGGEAGEQYGTAFAKAFDQSTVSIERSIQQVMFGDPVRRQDGVTVGTGAPGLQGALQNIPVPDLREITGRPKYTSFTGVDLDAFGADLDMRKRASLELVAPFGKQPITSKYATEDQFARGSSNDERNAERMAAAIGRELGPLIAMVSGGGARGAVAGLAGITGTLGSLNDPKGHPLLGSASPYLALASGVLSGITSLFGSGQKPKVIITAFEEEAARQIKELRSDPATTQIIVIGSTDMRSTQQALGHLRRMGVITR